MSNSPLIEEPSFPDEKEPETSETAFSRFGGGNAAAGRRSYGGGMAVTDTATTNDDTASSPIANVFKNNTDLLTVEMSQPSESLFAVNDDDDDDAKDFTCTSMNSDNEGSDVEGSSQSNQNNLQDDEDDDGEDVSDDETVQFEVPEPAKIRGRTKRAFRSVLESTGEAPTSTMEQEKCPASIDSEESQETSPSEEASQEKETVDDSAAMTKDGKEDNNKTASPTAKKSSKSKDDEKKVPDKESLITSIDNLFVHADKQTVTVRDIVRSLEAEYGIKIKKPLKAIVKTHLTDLIKGNVEPSVEAPEAASESEDEEVSDAGDAYESESSDEEEVKRRAPKRKKKAKSTKRISPRQKTSKKKPSHVRIHAEMLRKRRIEELRVRNEELQIKQSKEDQKRAEQIAAKFETDTDELRLKRLEDRLDLLQKLDQKRIRVISDESVTGQVQAPKQEKTDKVPPTDAPPDKEEAPAAAPTDDSDDEDSDDDFELEIVGKDEPAFRKEPVKIPKASSSGPPIVTKSSAINMLDMVGGLKPKPKRTSTISLTADQPQASPGRSMSARAALRNSLRAKQRKGANMWLARELGYKTQEEHMRDCLLVEQKKREDVMRREEERLKANERKVLRERMLLESNPYVEMEEEEEEYNPDEDAGGGGGDNGNESDEEMAQARMLEEEQNADGPLEGATASSQDDADPPAKVEPERETDNDADKPSEHDPKDESVSVEAPSVTSDTDSPTLDASAPPEDTDSVQQPNVSTDKACTHNVQAEDDVLITDGADGPLEEDDDAAVPFEDDDIPPPSDSNAPAIDPNAEDSSSPAEKPESADNNEDAIPADDEPKDNEDADMLNDDSSNTDPVEQVKENKAPKEKNAGWKAMLQKEAEKRKKQKDGNMGKGLVEAEADEEEEEEVAGLEDFGFSLGNKKKDDEEGEDDDADKITEEDLKHVVDDVSDDEGDEEAGQAARKKLEQIEEKERHKEIIRRMREGYDGRRGGIAGAGVGARGMHRFDQLVAADNREDAKRLGLLNDDELDSDDDSPKGDGNGDDEEEDENALLDKMLKDRFLHRSSLDEEVQEYFSSDEEEEEEINDDEGKKDNDDDEKEQERLAKRFSKRARMQRLIEQHGEDEEFSQLRLIDEDETTRLELKMMKSVPRKSRDTSLGSSSRTASQSSGNDSQETCAVFGVSTKRSSSLALGTSSLSLALQASRASKKKKTSFLGGSGASKELSSTIKSVSMGHVVFNTGGDSQLSMGGKSSRSNLSTFKQNKGKRKRSTMQTSQSLWSQVAVNAFTKKTRS